MSSFWNIPTSPIHLDDLDDSGSQPEIIETLKNEAERRGFQRALDTNGVEVEFKIELPDDGLAHMPVPKYFLCDSLVWKLLPGEEEDSLERGIVIGMRWVPTVIEWEYLIHLDKSSPSRALGIYSDWASEPDLLLQDQIELGTEWVDLED